jgi:hypothetical protein
LKISTNAVKMIKLVDRTCGTGIMNNVHRTLIEKQKGNVELGKFKSKKRHTPNKLGEKCLMDVVT